MSKLKLITLAASIMLAITFTISCSDDKDAPAYLTCEGLGKLMQEQEDIWDNVGSLKEKCKAEKASEIQKQCGSNKECAQNIVLACMQNDDNVKKLCGNNNVTECGAYYGKECPELFK